MEQDGVYMYFVNKSRQWLKTTSAFDFKEDPTYHKCVRITNKRENKNRDTLFFTKKDYGALVDLDTIPEEDRFYSEKELWGDLRIDPIMIDILENMEPRFITGAKIVEIPDDVEWEIEENRDGSECIAEKHRRWD